MRCDPRLANLTVLVLAAKRRQAARHVLGWERTEGLAALLAAKPLPTRDDPDDPWPMHDGDMGTGLGKMLAEARARQPERPW